MELKEKLSQNRLRQLRQRILVYYNLDSLNYEDTQRYIHHRLTLAGSEGRPRFTHSALKKVYNASKGIPRMINNICDKSLLSSYIRSSDEVTYWDVRRALKELRIK